MILFLTALLISGYCDALTCNQTVNPPTYRRLWSDNVNDYNDVTITYPPNCMRQNLHEICDYDVVLGDGAIIQFPPDLNSSSYFEHFIGISNSMNSYIDFDHTTVMAGITAIELSFLNSPANRISLPDIAISIVINSRTVTPIASWILDNQDLTQTDNQIRTISIRPFTPLSAVNLRIRFQFTVFHDFNWIFLSEVRFCTDLQPNLQPEVTFQIPPSNNIQPSAKDLRRGSTELVCTVSSEGSYTWRWERDNNMIENKGDYRITIGDGSRTTKLTINKLGFSDAAEYECTGITRLDANVMNSTVYVLEFPERVITTPGVSGYLQTGEVTLTCELHGYQSSLSSPVWLNTNGSETNDSTKYTVSVCEGNNTITLQNGTIVPSIILSITIHNLSLADGGAYTCRGVRGESVTQLTILEGTDPNMLSQTCISTSIEGITPTPSPGNETTTRVPVMNETIVIIAAAVGSVIIVLTILLLIIFIVYLLRKINKMKICLTEALQVPNSLSIQEREDTSISVQDVTYEEIAERHDMLLTNNEAYVCVSTPLENRN